MKKSKNINNDEHHKKIICDTVRQLKSGLHCFVFNKEQVDAIKIKFEETTGIDLIVNEIDGNFLLNPTAQFNNYMHF